MAVIKQIVCLANSRKLNGRCIAGKETGRGIPGGWIRPVSARENEEVSEYERQYKDGSDPHVLDIINIPLLEPKPIGYQQENWLLDPNSYWEKVGQIPWSDLQLLIDIPGPLWINGYHTYNGYNDKIPLEFTKTIDSSLRLIRVESLILSMFRPGEFFGNPKRRVQGRFRYEEADYWIWVTDPRYEREYLAKPDGEYNIGESFITVSLGEPYNDVCYKLMSAIIERD